MLGSSSLGPSLRVIPASSDQAGGEIAARDPAGPGERDTHRPSDLHIEAMSPRRTGERERWALDIHVMLLDVDTDLRQRVVDERGHVLSFDAGADAEHTLERINGRPRTLVSVMRRRVALRARGKSSVIVPRADISYVA